MLPLTEVLDRIDRRAPVSLEVPNPAAREDPAAWIRHLADAARELLRRGALTPRMSDRGPGPDR